MFLKTPKTMTNFGSVYEEVGKKQWLFFVYYILNFILCQSLGYNIKLN